EPSDQTAQTPSALLRGRGGRRIHAARVRVATPARDRGRGMVLAARRGADDHPRDDRGAPSRPGRGSARL
ncbi:MAG: hypothetical protein AVDCRST_MAG64-2378, partial [uncultured Phycisphaerae bacterium]